MSAVECRDVKLIIIISMVVGRNDEACIRYLLKHGANPSFGPKARAQGHVTQKRAIYNSGDILNQAAAYCSPEIFALLLSHGASLSNVDAIPLHHAAGHGASPHGTPCSDPIAMMEYLVGTLGMDVNAMDDPIKIAPDGRGQRGTPLMYAVYWGRVEEAKWLLSNGADPDRKTPWGSSARDLAKRLPPIHELAYIMRKA
jgi:ankyrin repeat protein